jgi:DNA-binding MarR family transcriptional regulator
MSSPNGITSRLDRLEKLGLIERRASPEDRRSLLVVLTAQGRKASSALPPGDAPVGARRRR